jgi:hypothetical protein
MNNTVHFSNTNKPKLHGVNTPEIITKNIYTNICVCVCVCVLSLDFF